MKKKVLIISSVVVLLVAIVLLLVLSKKPAYTIRVSLVDDHSPDRILTVYNRENEKVEVKRIEYLTGELLCEGYNTAVYYGDIQDVNELKVILKDKSAVTARIIKDEVK